MGHIAGRRAFSFVLVGAGLTVGYAVMPATDWQGDGQMHILAEATATLLALMVGTMALVGFYSKKNNTFLFIGAGFIGTALLDAYHSVVLVVPVTFLDSHASTLDSHASTLIAWSWIASRLFLALLLCWSWHSWTREKHLGRIIGKVDDISIYLIVSILALASFAAFAFAPLPRAYYPELIVHRPEEFLPAIFFLIALAGYLAKGAWRTDFFEYWLVMALILGLVGQCVFMAFSERLFDLEFYAAHLMKITGYACVLVGLMASMYTTFREAEERQARLHGVLTTVASGIVTTDTDGKIRSFNPAAERIFGYRSGEIVGRNIKALMTGDDRKNHDKNIKSYLFRRKDHALLNGGTSKVLGMDRELNAKRKNGTIVPILISVCELNVSGYRGFVGVINDITKQKEYEQTLRQHADEIAKSAKELARSNAELEQFASVASHDLQEPLRKVRAFSDRLRNKYKSVLDDQGRDYLERMHDAAERMQSLVTDLLSFSRVTTKGEEFVPVSLNQAVRDALTDLEVRIEETGAQIDVANMPTIDAAPLQMRQLFLNLISNSLKYARENVPPHVKITGDILDGTVKGAGGNCQVTVEDNGMGFEERYAERIFGIFQRLHGRGEYEGTGVGLAICRKIVERHGGTISARSRPGKGTTFTMTLQRFHTSSEAA